MKQFTKYVPFKCSEELEARLSAISVRENWTKSETIRNLLEKAIEMCEAPGVK